MATRTGPYRISPGIGARGLPARSRVTRNVRWRGTAGKVCSIVELDTRKTRKSRGRRRLYWRDRRARYARLSARRWRRWRAPHCPFRRSPYAVTDTKEAAMLLALDVGNTNT